VRRALFITGAKKAVKRVRWRRTHRLNDEKPCRSRAFCWNGSGLDRDRGKFGWVDVDEAAVLALVLEADDAVDLGEEGVVFAAAYVGSGLERGASLLSRGRFWRNLNLFYVPFACLFRAALWGFAVIWNLKNKN
jgi:hypothetical protein